MTQGLGETKRDTSHNHIIGVYKGIQCIKDYSPIFCQRFPKELITPTSSRGLQGDIDQRCRKAGEGCFAAGWETIARGAALWVPGC